MKILDSNQAAGPKKEVALCPLFGECGGCQYQDIAYRQECYQKEEKLKSLLYQLPIRQENIIEPIIPSPLKYHYRSRLDLKLIKTKDNNIFIGFSPVGKYRVVPADSCSIALKAISEKIPEIKEEASRKLPADYRNANLVIKTGDDGRVFWGGIGRRSLRMKEEDYFWTMINNKKIFYSLETFFQANLSILPIVMNKIEELGILDKKKDFYDLYGGVGLFGVSLNEHVRKVILIEENIYSIMLAEFNKNYHQLKDFEIVSGRVEDQIEARFNTSQIRESVALIDPPRDGLSSSVLNVLAETSRFSDLLYLSCNPHALIRDLAVLSEKKWQIQKILPFDFFPQTKHIETLVWLTLV